MSWKKHFHKIAAHQRSWMPDDSARMETPNMSVDMTGADLKVTVRNGWTIVANKDDIENELLKFVDENYVEEMMDQIRQTEQEQKMRRSFFDKMRTDQD